MTEDDELFFTGPQGNDAGSEAWGQHNQSMAI